MASERRCDGCGTTTTTYRTFFEAGGATQNGIVLGTYCYGCCEHMERNDIQPGGHEQYQLLEAGDV